MKPTDTHSLINPELTPWRALAVLVGLGVCVLAGRAPAAPVTTESLVREMTDLRGMAEYPDPAYVCRQFSSYDRASKDPATEWFANGDAGHFLRVEERAGRREHVMMDVQGPGAIVRIWSANPAGTLRIYVDDAPEPVIEAPMTNVLGGNLPSWPRPVAGEYSRGWNLYFPIPYARRCLVTSDQGGFYYHVNYRTYREGTPVTSFRRGDLERLGPLGREVAGSLADPRAAGRMEGGQWERFEVSVGPGETVSQEFTGPAAIAGAVVQLTAGTPEPVLRSLVVTIRFDGETCVEAPLGDLFGSAPGLNPYLSLPLGVTARGEMYSHWYMPFREGAVIEVRNLGRETAGLAGRLQLVGHRWTERSMHFHARWRAQFDVPTRPMIDWNYLTVRGRGVFAGAAFFIDNPVRDWWGEGDEKIYVDGESFPSHFGTGTEDYFGYAWCWPETFTHAYHAQPRCDGPGNYGRTSVNRFHILDRIPFERDFRFDMELWHWHARCQVNMAVTAYWYAAPGGKDGFPGIREADVVLRPMVAYVAPRVAGAIEGEEMRRIEVAGTAEPQDWANLSGDRQLWWHAGMKPGDKLTLGFPVAQAGRYRVWGRFLQARDYGVHQLAVNGVMAGGPRDFYKPDVTATEEVDLGIHDLRAGENRLSAVVVGANPRAEKAYMFGLDYLRLVAE